MARIKGLRREDGKRHQVTIVDHAGEYVLGENTVWVGTSSGGKPELGAYVNRRDFLVAVAKALNVEFYDYQMTDTNGDNYQS